METRAVKELGKGKKNQKVQKQKYGSGVLPRSFVNILQTVFVVESLPESTDLSLHDSHNMWIVCACVYICWCNIHI